MVKLIPPPPSTKIRVRLFLGTMERDVKVGKCLFRRGSEVMCYQEQPHKLLVIQDRKLFEVERGDVAVTVVTKEDLEPSHFAYKRFEKLAA